MVCLLQLQNPPFSTTFSILSRRPPRQSHMKPNVQPSTNLYSTALRYSHSGFSAILVFGFTSVAAAGISAIPASIHPTIIPSLSPADSTLLSLLGAGATLIVGFL